MLSMGVDVARGGRDSTVIARRHEGYWFDVPLVYPVDYLPALKGGDSFCKTV
jgi:hypothetical protein